MLQLFYARSLTLPITRGQYSATRARVNRSQEMQDARRALIFGLALVAIIGLGLWVALALGLTDPQYWRNESL